MALVNLRSCELLRPDPQPEFLKQLRRMEELAALDRSGRYELTADPDAAAFLLFVEGTNFDSNCGPYLEGVRADPIYQRYRRKSLVYSAYDFPVPLVPGVYPSIDRSWSWRSVARPGPYIAGSNSFIPEYLAGERTEPDLLASFVGCTSDQPVRRRLAQISDRSILIADTTEAFLAAVRSGREDEVNRFKREFVATVARSRFVLCPRGFGASSIRLFEAMQMSRVPVILSDEWVPPEGPAWDTFSIQVRERDVLRLPDILRERATESAELGRRARLAWDEWFAPDQLFRRICDTCSDMLATRRPRDRVTQALCYLHFARPDHARKWLRRLRRGAS